MNKFAIVSLLPLRNKPTQKMAGEYTQQRDTPSNKSRANRPCPENKMGLRNNCYIAKRRHLILKKLHN